MFHRCCGVLVAWQFGDVMLVEAEVQPCSVGLAMAGKIVGCEPTSFLAISEASVPALSPTTETDTMLTRLLRTRALLRYGTVTGRHAIARRTLVAAPKAGDGPLMERRPDRELPGMYMYKATDMQYADTYLQISNNPVCAGYAPFPSSSPS